VAARREQGARSTRRVGQGRRAFELRRWFHEAPQERRDEFADRYSAELDDAERQSRLDELRAQAKKQTVTLLTATRDVEYSHVPVLLRHLK
jgi:uncharacterized protein YeaO (DUF488 family)